MRNGFEWELSSRPGEQAWEWVLREGWEVVRGNWLGERVKVAGGDAPIFGGQNHAAHKVEVLVSMPAAPSMPDVLPPALL
jgi:hypothetical protein